MIRFLFSLLLLCVPIQAMQQKSFINIPTTLPLHQLLTAEAKKPLDRLSNKLEREYQTINLDCRKDERFKSLQCILRVIPHSNLISSPQKAIGTMLNDYIQLKQRAQQDNKAETIEFINNALIAIYRTYIKNAPFDELAQEQKAIAALRVSADIEQNNITPFLDLAEKRVNKTIDGYEPLYTMTVIGKVFYALWLESLEW